MRIAIGADHGGYEYKNQIIEMLKNNGYTVKDFGTDSAESCDYPEFAKRVAAAVASKEFDRGILICGTGIGMSIAANKQKGIRAALCSDLFSAKATREHNDSNILCLGARVIDIGLALQITEVWLNTPFSNEERHLRRIGMIE
ncbi:MAG: ribose 5-phosphate isomerase B [Alphaproteobacteria bacterium]|nr:ribose 5-phosphate isomerase B [Alphaproteobacteria bacterium]